MAVYIFIIGLKHSLSVDSMISPLPCPVKTPSLAAVDDRHVGSFKLMYTAQRQFMIGGWSSAFHTWWLMLSAVSITNMLDVLQPTRILLSCCSCAADHSAQYLIFSRDIISSPGMQLPFYSVIVWILYSWMVLCYPVPIVISFLSSLKNMIWLIEDRWGVTNTTRVSSVCRFHMCSSLWSPLSPVAIRFDELHVRLLMSRRCLLYILWRFSW